MGKKIKQFKNTFQTDQEVLIDNYNKVVQLGVQAKPGTKFKINQGNELIIGKTGIYELSLENSIYIHSLKFTEETSAIIDILYEEQEEE